MLLFGGGATRRVSGFMTVSPDVTEVGGRNRVNPGRVLTLASDDAKGLKPGDHAEAQGARYRVVAVLDHGQVAEVELAAA